MMFRAPQRRGGGGAGARPLPRLDGGTGALPQGRGRRLGLPSTSTTYTTPQLEGLPMWQDRQAQLKERIHYHTIELTWLAAAH